jgi:hypothetical protein
MKKTLLVLSAIALNIAVVGCSTSRPVIINSEILKSHQAPYKVFGLGNWSQGYSIITLTDANNQYFTIKAINVDLLKVGDEYKPTLVN